MKRLLISALVLVLSSCAPAGTSSESGPEAGLAALNGDDIRRRLEVLSHDSLEGRAPGSRGGEMAAAYIASEFEAMGLEPIGGSYLQPVPMVGSTPLAEGMQLTFSGPNGDVSGSYLTDFVLWSGDAEAEVVEGTAELVFVGYGITAPENDWLDFDDIDVTGKILLVLVNDPPAPAEEPELFAGRAMTYYGRWTYKFEEAARQGALGALMVHETEAAGYGWGVVSGSWSGEQFSLPADPGAPAPTPLQGWLSNEMTRRVLALGGHDLDEFQMSAASRDFSPVATGIQVSAHLNSGVRTVETMNVVGLLRGSERPDEVITVTSHYDHLGIGQTVDGDSIYNGAYDNASGSSLLLNVAQGFSALPAAPARSILFMATAAEEQGLLGAAWYVQTPLFPLAQTVAEINVDGANLWGESVDMTVFGVDRNELGAIVRARAAEMDIILVPDQEPEKGFFFRSDHFPFARAGVPSLYIEHGYDFRNRNDGEEIRTHYQEVQYHQPADEFSADYVYDGAVQQATFLFLIAYDIAQDDGWPNWLPGSEFKAARDAQRK